MFTHARVAGFCALFALGGLGPIACGDSDQVVVQSGPDRAGGVRDPGNTDDGRTGGRGAGAPDTGGAGAGADDTAPSADVDFPSLDAETDVDTGPGPDGTPAEDSGPPPGPGGGVEGTVWAPGNAPGLAAIDQEIPVSGALVYLHTDRPDPIPQRAYCAACQTPPSRAVLTDASGRFQIDGHTAGIYWLVIEKGQFRLEREIEVVADTVRTLDSVDTTLPSRNAPEEGMWTPRIALAAGSYDHLEDIFGKMDLGDVDSGGEYVPESSRGVLDLYANGGTDGGAAVGDLDTLVRDLSRLLDYHILFIPCSGDSNTSALSDQGVLRNLRDYVAAGGNLYVTDWSGEWHDNVFPEQIQLGDGLGGFLGGGVDTPADAYDRGSDTWNTGRFGNADGDAYDTPNAEAVDPDLRAWLHGQVGPTAHDDAPSTYDAERFEVEGNWNTIESTNPVEVGVDDRGDPIIDEPHTWVTGGSTLSPLPKKPLTVSYEPAGCGRVVFSTYHTTDDRHVGLAPQERVLLYLIMEIGTCRDPKR